MTRTTCAVGLSLCVALSACGLAPHDRNLPPIPSDGVSGLSPVGPIEFCIGQGRVVAPALGSAISLCVANQRKAVTCTSDADCTPPEQCYCGRCVVHACALAGLGCTDQQVCVGNQCTEQCTSEADCPQGFTCRGGGCARSCTRDDQCPYGELCDSLAAVCRVKLCDDFGQSCAQGQRCEALETVGEMREPFVVSTPQGERFYLELNQGTTSAIYRARAKQPLRWVADPSTPVLSATEPADNGLVGAPALTFDGSQWVLYFASGGGVSIDRATSADGIAFTRDPKPVLVASSTGWESGRVSSPSVVDFRGRRYLLYEGGRGGGIGLATLDAGQATRVGASPVIGPRDVEDPVFWREVSEVGTPDVVLVGDVARIYFTGHGTEGGDALAPGKPVPADPNDSIGLFTTRDFVHFQSFPDGPVFARRTNIRAYLGEREPFVKLDANSTRLYYVTSDASGKALSGLALATAPRLPAP